MASRNTPEHPRSTQSASPQWSRLEQEFPQDPRLALETLYALPIPLLDQIERRCNGLFSTDDVQFERRLRANSATGFWRRQPFFSQILDQSLLNEPRWLDVEDDAIVDASKLCAERVALDTRDLLTDRGDSSELESRARSKRAIQSEIHESLKGYVGWLATEGNFACDVHLLRGILPSISRPRELPGWQTGKAWRRIRRAAPQKGDLEIGEFLRAWSLDRLVTWELPEPIFARFRPGEDIPPNGLSPKGFTVFIPWPLLANRTLNFGDFAIYHKHRQDLSFLQPWLDGIPQWGPERFARMLDLYIYRELALVQRYGNRLHGHGPRLDLAFAAFWEPGATESELETRLETVRKIRGQLKKRQRQMKAALQELQASLSILSLTSQ
jgi:hypothetical protein